MSNESFFDKVKDFITGHPEQADQGLDKAAEVVDERTGARYSEQIAKGDDMVRERLGIPEDEATLPEPSPDPAPAPGDPPSVPSEPAPTPGTAPEPRTPIDPGPDPDAPGTAPPVPSPDPVPTSAPETIPESSPETTSTDPGART
jgi:hypothetical protein